MVSGLYSTEIWMLGVPSFLLGLVLGIVISVVFFKSKRSAAQLQKKIIEMESEFKNYHKKVNEHFLTTSHLMSDFTHKYREMHHHITSGATDLCLSNQLVKNILQDDFLSTVSIPEQENLSESKTEKKLTNMPPKDYVSKKN